MLHKTKKLIFIFLATIFALSSLMVGLGSKKALADSQTFSATCSEVANTDSGTDAQYPYRVNCSWTTTLGEGIYNVFPIVKGTSTPSNTTICAANGTGLTDCYNIGTIDDFSNYDFLQTAKGVFTPPTNSTTLTNSTPDQSAAQLNKFRQDMANYLEITIGNSYRGAMITGINNIASGTPGQSCINKTGFLGLTWGKSDICVAINEDTINNSSDPFKSSMNRALADIKATSAFTKITDPDTQAIAGTKGWAEGPDGGVNYFVLIFPDNTSVTGALRDLLDSFINYDFFGVDAQSPGLYNGIITGNIQLIGGNTKSIDDLITNPAGSATLAQNISSDIINYWTGLSAQMKSVGLFTDWASEMLDANKLGSSITDSTNYSIGDYFYEVFVLNKNGGVGGSRKLPLPKYVNTGSQFGANGIAHDNWASQDGYLYWYGSEAQTYVGGGTWDPRKAMNSLFPIADQDITDIISADNTPAINLILASQSTNTPLVDFKTYLSQAETSSSSPSAVLVNQAAAGAGQAVAGATSGFYSGGYCVDGTLTDVSQLINDFPQGAICWAEKGVLGGISWFFQKFVTPFGGVLNVASQDLSQNPVVNQVSGIFVQFINSLFLLVALISILVTTLKIDIPGLSLNTWQLKRMVPTIIATMIFVNYSLSIANLVIEIMNYLLTLFPIVGTTSFVAAGTNLFSVANATWGMIAFRIIFLIAYLLIILYLLLLLWLRKIVLIVLYMFAPVPYITNIIPVEAIKKLTSQWWSQFVNWAFMGPLVAIFLFATGIALKASTTVVPNVAEPFPGLATVIPSGSTVGSQSLSLTNMILVSVLLYLAATMPLKLGGAIMAGLQKATTAKAGKAISGAAKGVAKFQTSKITKSMGLSSIEDIKKGFAENRRVQLAKAEEKGAKKREKLFGGVSSTSDIFENYANLRGIAKLPFTTKRQNKAQKDLAVKNEKVEKLQKSGVKSDAPEMLQAKEEAKDALDKYMSLKPANYNTRTERLGRMGEELKKLGDVNRQEELIVLFQKAEREGNQTRAAAIVSKLAANGDLNNLQNAYGYDSDTKGLHGFVDDVLVKKMGMSEQQAYEIGSDASYQAEKNGQWKIAKAYSYKDGKMDKSSLKDQIEASEFDFKKLEPQKMATSLSRLSFITERADGTSFLDEDGLRKLSIAAAGHIGQTGRLTQSQAENLTKDNLVETMMGEEGKKAGISEKHIRTLIGKTLGYDEKQDVDKINSINLKEYVQSMKDNGNDWRVYKATLGEGAGPEKTEAKKEGEAPVGATPSGAGGGVFPAGYTLPEFVAPPAAILETPSIQVPTAVPGTVLAQQPTVVPSGGGGAVSVLESHIADFTRGMDTAKLESLLTNINDSIKHLNANPRDQGAIIGAAQLVGLPPPPKSAPGGGEVDVVRKLTEIASLISKQVEKK